MSWFSILPEPFAFVETWAIRFFVSYLPDPQASLTDSTLQLLLGIIAIGPWVLLIIYDMFLYIFRTATYEIPYVGGRARNRPKPKAPSLSERPSGKPRSISLTLSGPGEFANTTDGLKNRGGGLGHERHDSGGMSDE